MIYVVLMAAVFLADYIIKDRIEKKDPKDVVRTIAGGRIKLQRFHNTGMCMSIMKGRQKLVMAISLIFTLFVTIYFIVTLTKGGSVLLKTGLALLLGGAYSNVYDRMKRNYVVDYFSFVVKHKRLKNIVFNISDFFIAAGAALMVISSR